MLTLHFYSGINSLPAKCLNGEAIIATESGVKWVNLSPNMKYHRRLFVQANLDEDYNISGICQVKEKEYAGQSIRYSVRKKGGIEEYIEDQKNDLTNFEITNYELTNLEQVSQPVGVKMEFTNESAVEEMGDLIAIDPILFKDFDENPFKKDHREFAVDFNFPIGLEYTYIYTIPEGYAFDEIPKPTRVANADQTISFLMNTSANGQSATITLKFEIKNAMYTPDKS